MHDKFAVVLQGSGHLAFTSSSGGSMSIFMIVFLLLIVAWFAGWILFHVTSGLIHILLVVAVVSLILHFVRGRHGEGDMRINR
jgi:uncharacterized protein DUF5670